MTAPLNAELSAYLERLVHPARKAYATAYAEHIVTGAAQPEVPSGMDSDTAAKIVRKVTRYTAAPRTPNAGVSEQPQVCPQGDAAEGLQHLPDAVRAYAAEHGDTELFRTRRRVRTGGAASPDSPWSWRARA